jgi:uncharacterized membrane protein YbhN (UPF0104 family)
MILAGRSGRRALGMALGTALFAVAAWVIVSQLRRHSIAAVIAELGALAPLRLMLSLGASALGYAALAGHDVVSLRSLGYRVPPRTVALASFIGFAFANNLPLSLITGAAVRYRLYAERGLTPAQTASVVALNTITYVLGLLTTLGLVFTLQPVLVPGFLRLPLYLARPVGLACLALVGGYLAWNAAGRGPIRLGRWRLPANPGRAALQVLVSMLDWVLSALALFVLLPRGIPFLSFFGVFMLGQVASLLAQVPGGLGVFEAVVFWCLEPAASPPAILGALFAYRAIYFFLPLLIASGLWGAREGRRWLGHHR